MACTEIQGDLACQICLLDPLQQLETLQHIKIGDVDWHILTSEHGAYLACTEAQDGLARQICAQQPLLQLEPLQLGPLLPQHQ